MCCCFEHNSSGKQRKKLQLLIKSFLLLSCQAQLSCCFQRFLSFFLQFQLALAASWSPCSFFLSFCCSPFPGLEHWCWNPFLLATWSTQIATIRASLFCSPAPFASGQFCSIMHKLEVTCSLMKALHFPITALVLSSADPHVCISFQLARNFSFLSSVHTVFLKGTARACKR